jgi:hypothetical protein
MPLQSLIAWGTRLDDTGLAMLSTEWARMPSLRLIDLGGTNISDDGLRHLEPLKQLTGLQVTHQTQVTPAGLARLREELPGCHIE